MTDTPSGTPARNSLSDDLDNALGIESLSEAPTAFLVGLSGAHAGRLFRIKPGNSTIGRSSKAFVSLTEKATSHRHAQLTLTESGCVLEDLDSTNGTFVNDVRIESPRVLMAGDVLRIGNSALGYLTDAEDEQQHTRAMARITAPRMSIAPAAPTFHESREIIAISPTGESTELAQVRESQLNTAEEQSPLDNALDKLELIVALVRRYWLLLAICSATLGLAGVIASLLRPPPAVAEFLIYLRQERAPDPNQPTFALGMHGGEFFAFAERNFTDGDLVRKSLSDMNLPHGPLDVKITTRGLAFGQIDREGTFRGAYSDKDPDFAERFLAQHLQNFLSEEIGKSLTVLTSEVSLLEEEFKKNEKILAEVQGKLRDFKLVNGEALPENAMMQIQSKVTLQAQRDRLSADVGRAKSELLLVEQQLASKSITAPIAVNRADPYEKALSDVHRKIAAAQGQGFADAHPEIVKLRTEEKRLEALIRSARESETDATTLDADPEYRRLKDRRGELGVIVSATSQELGQVEARLGDIERIATKMPGVEADVAALVRSAESEKLVHDHLHGELKRKELELQFERASVAARYQVIQAPRAEPVSKSNAIIKSGGIGFGAGLFLAALLSALHWVVSYARTRKLTAA